MLTQDSRKPGVRPAREEVLADVKRLIGEHMEIPVETIREEHELIADLGCDSLDVVEIMMMVEEHFDLDVPDDAAEQARSVTLIVDGVLRLLGSD
jgi:acyl carrier protein